MVRDLGSRLGRDAESAVRGAQKPGIPDIYPLQSPIRSFKSTGGPYFVLGKRRGEAHVRMPNLGNGIWAPKPGATALDLTGTDPSEHPRE